MRLLVSHHVASAHGAEICARAAAAGDAIELIADYAIYLENPKRWQCGAALMNEVVGTRCIARKPA